MPVNSVESLECDIFQLFLHICASSVGLMHATVLYLLTLNFTLAAWCLHWIEQFTFVSEIHILQYDVVWVTEKESSPRHI